MSSLQLDFRCQVGIYILLSYFRMCIENICTYSRVSNYSVNKFYTNVQSYLISYMMLIFWKFCEGGDSQMDALIWYSWLGGVIIGTMIGANWVLEDYCREGPRNVVITGRYVHSLIVF